LKNIFSVIVASAITCSFVTANINKTTNAVSYRNEYTIYGDINADKRIDVYDVINMRNIIVEGNYNDVCDLNRDKKINETDLQFLQNYIHGESVIFDGYFNDDPDEDGVCDLVEISCLKSNPDCADTDEDTISDYDEIVYTRTSPTNKYTRSLAVTDAEDDYDEDNLMNAEEIADGTDPQSNDSDLDGINDYEEIKKYNTNPNDDDSDDDNVSDGDEVKLGLKPNNNKSDGETSDNERTFAQTISSDNALFSNINTDESQYTVSIEVNSAGIAEKSISVHTGEFANASEDNRIIGKSVSFSYNENLKTESAKVYFKLKEADKIENYMIFEYFPDMNYLLPVESKYTGDSVYTETSKLGTYCLVDISEEDVSMNKGARSFANSVILDYELGETEVAFLVDISGSLDETALEETKKSIRDFSQALFEHSENSYITIIGYYLNPVSYDTKIVQYTDSDGVALLNSTTSVDVAISKLLPCTNSKNNDLNTPVMIIDNLRNEGLFSSDCKNKYAFILSDSAYTMTNNIGYKVVIPDDTVDCLNYIHEDNIHINYILSAESYSKSKAVANLKKVCEPLEFGVYSKTATGNFAVNSFASIYSDAIIDLKAVSIAYTSSLNANTIPEKVDRNAFINSLPNSYDKTKVPDADTDGNIDFKEATVKIGAAQLDTNGNLIFPSLYDVCDISESTRIGLEQFMMNKAISDKLISGAIQIIPFSDKILYEDSDGDGMLNKDDPYPDEAFDERFMIVDDINYVPSIEFVEERYEKSRDCYNSFNILTSSPTDIDLMYRAKLSGITVSLLSMNNPSISDELISELLGLGYSMDFGPHPERSECSRSMNHAGFALAHYFANTGLPIIYNEADVCELLSCSKNNLDHFHRNLTRTMRCSEQILMDNQNISIASKKDSKFKAACNVNRGAIDGGFDCDVNNDGNPTYHSNGIQFNYVHRDWWNTIGEAGAAVVADVSRSGDEYIMDYTYYVIDIYEWAWHYDDDMLSGIFHSFHESGDAMEYLMIGSFSGTIKWKKGENAYTMNVCNQIKSTMQNWVDDSEQWNSFNEYDRFINDIINA